jgi:hypothetical protein
MKSPRIHSNGFEYANHPVGHLSSQSALESILGALLSNLATNDHGGSTV